MNAKRTNQLARELRILSETNAVEPGGGREEVTERCSELQATVPCYVDAVEDL